MWNAQFYCVVETCEPHWLLGDTLGAECCRGKEVGVWVDKVMWHLETKGQGFFGTKIWSCKLCGSTHCGDTTDCCRQEAKEAFKDMRSMVVAF